MAPKETKQKSTTKKSHPGGKPKGPKPPKPQLRKPPPSTTTFHIETPSKLQAPPPLPTTSPCGTLPLNWPSHLPYLTAPLFSPLLTPSHYSALRTRPPADSIEPLDELPADYVAGPCKKAVILPITDQRHPACGQAGLFAARDLKPGEFVVRYLGEIHPGGEEWGGELVFSREEEEDGAEQKREDRRKQGVVVVVNQDQHKAQDQDDDGEDNIKAEPSSPSPSPEEEKEENPKYNYKQSDYDLWLDHALDLAIDAARCGNEARYVNDYRGVPNPAFPPGYKPQSKKDELFMKRPNAEFKVVWDPPRQERTMAVYVLPAGKKAVGKAREVGIAGGEEVVVSYGKGFWEGRRRAEEEEKSREVEGYEG